MNLVISGFQPYQPSEKVSPRTKLPSDPMDEVKIDDGHDRDVYNTSPRPSSTRFYTTDSYSSHYPRMAHHIQLEYDSYTKALLTIPPPRKDTPSDESDIETVGEVRREEIRQPPPPEMDNESEELEFEEDENPPMPANEVSKRPSVIELPMTIEKLIEFGDEKPPGDNNPFNVFNTPMPQNNNQGASSGPDSSTNLDDLFLNEKLTTPNYSEMFQHNPDELKSTLIQLNNLSLSAALYQIMSSDAASEYILSLARETGSNGSRILSLIPALVKSTFNIYLEQRKIFCIEFNMFEGNFSLYDFTQQNRSNPPPPGNPPVSLEVVKLFSELLNAFLKAFRDRPQSQLLADDGYDAFQAYSYIVAKLKQFKVQIGYVESTVIPMYNNIHKRMLHSYEQSGLPNKFPKEPFNFDDPVILKRLRPPQHKDIFQNVDLATQAQPQSQPNQQQMQPTS